MQKSKTKRESDAALQLEFVKDQVSKLLEERAVEKTAYEGAKA